MDKLRKYVSGLVLGSALALGGCDYFDKCDEGRIEIGARKTEDITTKFYICREDVRSNIVDNKTGAEYTNIDDYKDAVGERAEREQREGVNYLRDKKIDLTEKKEDKK